MKTVEKGISLVELKILAKNRFGNMVKAVVDISSNIMVVDAELHADEEALLIENGSKQADLWGINIYPELGAEDRIEFDSMINIKPNLGNRSRSIDDPAVCKKIREIVNVLIK